MRKDFIVRCDEYNHVFYTRTFNVIDNLNELQFDESIDNAKIQRLNSDPEDKSALDYELYKITFKSGCVEYYALKIPYSRSAKTSVYDNAIVITVNNFGEQGFYEDSYDFHPKEFTGIEFNDKDELKEFMLDCCIDQLDSVFGLLADDDYKVIYNGIDKWCDKWIKNFKNFPEDDNPYLPCD